MESRYENCKPDTSLHSKFENNAMLEEEEELLYAPTFGSIKLEGDNINDPFQSLLKENILLHYEIQRQS